MARKHSPRKRTLKRQKETRVTTKLSCKSCKNTERSNSAIVAKKRQYSNMSQYDLKKHEEVIICVIPLCLTFHKVFPKNSTKVILSYLDTVMMVKKYYNSKNKNPFLEKL